MRALEDGVLENAQARLETLAEAHRFVFYDLVGQTDKAHWQYLSKVALGNVEGWFDWLIEQHESRRAHVYAVFDKLAGAWAGCTSFMNADPAHDRLEIGGTWYVPTAQGGTVNPAAKLLLLEYAFGDLECHRVELKCDVLNLRSRRAIVKLGATEEGVLRGHMKVHDGKGGIRYRDTIYHSILAGEWPRVKESLTRRLRAPAAAREEA